MIFAREKPAHLSRSELPANDDHYAVHDEVILHPELEAMARIRSLLEPLDGPARTRVLQWIVESLEIAPNG